MKPLEDLEVQSVMTPAPERLPHDFTVAEAARFLLNEGISGAPVVSVDGVTMSVISTTDLLREISVAIFEREASEGCVAALRSRSIGEILTESAVTCQEGTKLVDACALMARARVHRIIITRQAQPVGILTALDVARIVGGLAGPHSDS